LLQKYSKVIIVKGNHDKIIEPIALKKGISVVDYYSVNPDTIILHGDIIPSEKLMLDDKLDFLVMPNNQRMKIKTTRIPTYIQIANIKGFDLMQTFSPFRYIEFVDIITIKDFKKIYWTMSELNFDFYIENDIIEKNNCNQSLLNDYNYFHGLQYIILEKSVKFPFEICPYVFKNVFF
jgi:hypothetical protein